MGIVSDDATILKIKHEVLTEVAKLAFAGELDEKKDNLPYEMIPGPKRVSAAVFTRKGKLSDRESDSQKENVLVQEKAATLCRLSTQPVRNVLFHQAT